ncbi:MAG: hypothetical protein BJ554DRAFT_6330, partial [Olpidium bornovanus]
MLDYACAIAYVADFPRNDDDKRGGEGTQNFPNDLNAPPDSADKHFHCGEHAVQDGVYGLEAAGLAGLGGPAAEDACDPGLIASAKTTCGAAVALVALVACGGRAQPSQSCLLRAGPEFRINTYTTDTQNTAHPATSSGVLRQGSGFFFFLAGRWLGKDGGRGVGDRPTKFPGARSLDFAGPSRATPIVADGGGGDDGRPGLVAVWTSNGQDGSGLGVYGQLYEQPLNTSGLVPVGAEFQVNVNTLFDQRRPSVAPLASGGFVVVYQSTVLVTPVSPRRVETIIARVFGPDGLPAGNEIAFPVQTQAAVHTAAGRLADAVRILGNKISQDASSQHVSPAVAGILDTTNGTSGFIVSWISYQVGITAGRNILVRVFGLDGVPITDETTVNSFSDSNFQSDITVASLPDGRNLVAWSAQADGVPSGAQPGSVSPLIVRGQLFDSAAHPEGPQFEISAASSILTNQPRPSIAGASDSSKGYVVAWQSKPVAPAGMPRKRSRLRAAPRLRAFSKRQTAPAPAPSAAPPQILAQRFDSKGVRISDRFQVNTFTGTDMGDAKAASRWDGGFVVVWDTLDADGDGYA